MEWHEWSTRLVEVLGLRKAPVAVVYTDEAPEGVEMPRCRVCSALGLAARGKTIALTAENSLCPGGSRYLGLRAEPEGVGRDLRDFLMHGEKLFSCPVAIHRMSALSRAQLPVGIAERVILAPLCQAPLRPDIVVITCNAWQAARLVNLVVFETGLPMECDPTGALCRAVITYPLVTGKTNVSFGDVTARQAEAVAEDELYVSLPYHDLASVRASIDYCSAGTAPAVIPEAFRHATQEGEGKPPEA